MYGIQEYLRSNWRPQAAVVVGELVPFPVRNGLLSSSPRGSTQMCLKNKKRQKDGLTALVIKTLPMHPIIFCLVVWNINFIFPYDLGMSSSQLTKSYFSEGWPNHQPVLMNIMYGITVSMAFLSWFFWGSQPLSHHYPIIIPSIPSIRPMAPTRGPLSTWLPRPGNCFFRVW